MCQLPSIPKKQTTAVYTISNKMEFNIVFPHFKESISISTNNTFQRRFLIGLDIEWIDKNNFPKQFQSYEGNQNTNNGKLICMIQIATDKICLVLNMIGLKDLPEDIINLLENESWIKVGVGINNDLRLLSQNFRIYAIGGIDILNIAYLAGHPSPSLQNLINEYVDPTFTKTQSSVIDWTHDGFHIEEQMYCAKDAIYSLKVFNVIINPTLTLIKNTIQSKIINAQEPSLSLKLSQGIKLQDSEEQSLSPVSTINIEQVSSQTILDCKNFVSILNEYAQKNRKSSPIYEEIEIVFADKTKYFQTHCFFDSIETIGQGIKKQNSKKEAAKRMVMKIMDLEVINNSRNLRVSGSQK
jgi:hypothetical protein